MLMMYRGRVRSSRRATPWRTPTRRGRFTSGRRRLDGLRLCGLRAVAAGIDADLARLDLLRLRDPQRQQPVGEGRLGIVALDPHRKLDRPVERAEPTLAVQVLI